ncbi:MAG: LCP family protein [Candidatus Limnocylindria bacterium]
MPLRLSRTAVAGIAAAVVVVIGIGVTLALTARWTPVATVGTATPATATPALTASPTPPPTPTPVPTPVPTATPVPLDQALLESRLTVLVLGLDSNRWRAAQGKETNTDAMIVASVNRDHTQIATVAMPRDTVDVPFSDGTYWTGKLNALSRFLGIDALRDAIETTLAVDIDYYIQVDMDDFAHLVDAVGGVDVEVPYALYDPSLGLYLDAGWQHLNGATAQYYSRSRKQDGDYARQARQQQVLLALVQKLSDPETEIDALELLGSLDSIQTDIPLDKIPTLVEIGRRSSGAEVSTQVLGPPRFALFEGIEGPARGWVMIPNIPEMQAYARAVMGGE